MSAFVQEQEYVFVNCGHAEHGGAFLFAVTREFYDWTRRGNGWTCPMGHQRIWTGKTPEQKLSEAEAQLVATRDQLDAATRETETVRSALLRDRQRFANGVCPCCNRSFQNVRRHMTTQHPDYDVARVSVSAVEFRCSCGKDFRSLHGLHIHQARVRPSDWATRARSGDSWKKRTAHTTAVGR